MNRLLIATIVIGLALLISSSIVRGQAAGPLFIGMGDSIGEGVQSGDANALTQPYSFINLLSLLMGAPVQLPYITTWPLGSVENVTGRTRTDPSTRTLNLAVSGADSSGLLTTRATATTTSQISTETDLVLFPNLGSQIELAEALRPQRVACWIGSNDALATVTAYDQLDGVSQLTPLAEFAANFSEIASRLAATGAQVVFGTIPDVTKIGYLIDSQDLQRLTGSSDGLPSGSYTTLVTAMSIQLGLLDRSVLADPNYVLDPNEVANIDQAIAAYNSVIESTAGAWGMGVADVAGAFNDIAAHPPSLYGVTLTTRFLGGLFSLDGIHPSDVGQLIIAKLFVEAFNRQYGLNIPDVSDSTVVDFFLSDPFIDRNGNGRVTGRPGAGLLETVGPLLGWSGDTNDVVPGLSTANISPVAFRVSGHSAIPKPFRMTNAARQAVLDRLHRATGLDFAQATRKQKLDVLARALGITRKRR